MKIAFLRELRQEPILRFLMQGSLVAMLTRAAGLVLSYVGSIILSHALGASGYGSYSIALAWALLLVLPSRAGLDNAALKFAAIYLNRSLLAPLRGFLNFAVVVIFVLSCITGIALFLWMKVGAAGTGTGFAAVTALMIFPLAALGLVAASLRAARLIFASQLYEQILRPAIFITLLLLAFALHERLTAVNALMLAAVSAFIALIFGSIHVRLALPSDRSRADYSQWRQWVSLSAPLLLTAIIQEALNQSDVVMLGFLANPKSAGLFAAAWRLASLISFGVAALTSISGPLIATLYEEKDWKRLARVTAVSAQIGFAAALAISLPLVLVGRPLLLVFGPEFGAAYPVLVTLLIGGLANAFTGSVGYLMTMTGRHLHAMWIFAGALCLSVLLNLLLIPRFGAVGAAVASSSAWFTWNFAMLVYVKRTLGIDASALAMAPRRIPS